MVVLQGLPEGAENGDGVDVTLRLDGRQSLEVEEVVRTLPDLEIHLRAGALLDGSEGASQLLLFSGTSDLDFCSDNCCVGVSYF